MPDDEIGLGERIDNGKQFSQSFAELKTMLDQAMTWPTFTTSLMTETHLELPASFRWMIKLTVEVMNLT